MVITTPFGTVTNYIATLEVKIPFSLVGLPGRLPQGIFDLQVSGTPAEPCRPLPIFLVGQTLLLGLCPATPSRSATQTPGLILSVFIASPRLRRRSGGRMLKRETQKGAILQRDGLITVGNEVAIPS